MNPSVPASAFEGTSRFEVRSVLGQGAHGVVYRAFDRETRREVALKTVGGSDAEHALLLRTEFRALARITHPNLVPLYDLVSVGTTSFLTMELIEGDTVATRIKEDGRLDLPELEPVARGLFDALAALHQEGRLHRDIKPSNIMIRHAPESERGRVQDGAAREARRVVLVDFGLSLELDRLAQSNNAFAGTLLYMAPEQAWGRAISEAADHYAAAAVLWEALLGSPPFEGRGAQLLFEKERAPSPPKDLDVRRLSVATVLSAMMDPTPEKRPTPNDLLDAFRDAGTPPPARKAKSIRRPSGTYARSPFVGRRRELSALTSALEDVQMGRAAFASVEGPSGIGKTELLSRFANAAEKSERAVVLRGRCHPRASVPYAGFDGIIDDLSEWLNTLADRDLARLVPREARALATVFPILGARLKTEPEAGFEDAYALRRRAVDALRELLTRVAQRSDSGKGPDAQARSESDVHTRSGSAERRLVVLWIDDAQWGSADAGQLIADIFRHPTPPVLLVLSYRSEDRGASSMLRTIEDRADLLRDSAFRLTLSPMGSEESRELAMLYLHDDEADVRPPLDLASTIARSAGGHPMYLRELAQATRARMLREEPHEAPDHERTSDLRSLLVERISRLDATEKDLLTLAAVAGKPLARRLLLSAIPGGERGRPLVFRLAHERLLRETWAGAEPAVEPYHGFVREAVLESINDDERRARHRVIADVLLREPEPDTDALVDHFVGAGELGQAGMFAEIAARRAEEALAFDRATDLFRLAIEHGTSAGLSSTRRHDLRARLGSVLANAGRSSESADAYASAAAEARASGDSAIAKVYERIAAEHALRGGDFEIGVHRLRSVLANAGVPYPTSALSAFATFVHQRARLAVRGLDYVPAPGAHPSAHILEQADACWTAGLGLTWIDRTRVAAYQARYMRLALESGDPRRVGLALSTEASQLACIGGNERTARAREILSRAKSMTDKLTDPVVHAFVRLMDASISFYASHWRPVIDLCESAEEILREAKIRSEWERLTSQTLSLAALAYAGEIATLRERQASLIAEAVERGNRLAFACLASGPANIGFLLGDDPDLARRRADEALAPWKDESFQLAHYFHLVARCQIDLYEGRPERTLQRLEEEWRRVQLSMSLQIQNFRVTLRHLRARALLATAVVSPSKRKRTALIDQAQTLTKRIEGEDVAWAKPLALALKAGAHATRGDAPRAAELLVDAAAEYRRIDMRLHSSACDLQRGRLLGGDSGRELLEAAESWMRSERVVSPARVAAMLIPID